MSTESERVARLTAEGERFVPEGTGPKVYVVTCKNKSDWDEIHNYIINDGELRELLPVEFSHWVQKSNQSYHIAN